MSETCLNFYQLSIRGKELLWCIQCILMHLQFISFSYVRSFLNFELMLFLHVQKFWLCILFYFGIVMDVVMLLNYYLEVFSKTISGDNIWPWQLFNGSQRDILPAPPRLQNLFLSPQLPKAITRHLARCVMTSGSQHPLLLCTRVSCAHQFSGTFDGCSTSKMSLCPMKTQLEQPQTLTLNLLAVSCIWNSWHSAVKTNSSGKVTTWWLGFDNNEPWPPPT